MNPANLKEIRRTKIGSINGDKQELTNGLRSAMDAVTEGSFQLCESHTTRHLTKEMLALNGNEESLSRPPSSFASKSVLHIIAKASKPTAFRCEMYKQPDGDWGVDIIYTLQPADRALILTISAIGFICGLATIAVYEASLLQMVVACFLGWACWRICLGLLVCVRCVGRKSLWKKVEKQVSSALQQEGLPFGQTGKLQQ